MKFIYWLLGTILFTLVLIAGVIGYSYYEINEEDFTISPLVVGEEEISYTQYQWNMPVLNGVTYKEFSHEDTALSHSINTDGKTLSVNSKANSDKTNLRVSYGGNAVFEGDLDEYSSFSFDKNGEYLYQITQEFAKGKEGAEYGSAYFTFNVNVSITPQIYISDTEILQGGVFTVIVKDNLDNLPCDIKTDLGFCTFAYHEGEYISYVPVAYNREVGDYDINVTCGDYAQTFTVEIIHRDFERQDLTISQEISDSTVNSADANAEYREVIWPFYTHGDDEIYWDGLFLRPVEGGWISSEYGLFRYTNGSIYPVRHDGIDFAVPMGTPVYAPNNGRVVVSQFLQLTGNTVLIEHGAGLKTYFYHMDTLTCNEGDMVSKGDQIGTVGTTGYSTGAHLHYNLMVGNQAINPWDSMDGTSGIFFK